MSSVRVLALGTAVSFVLLSIFSAVSASGSRNAAAVIPAFTPDQLNQQAGANWISEQGNIQSHRYSTLKQITPANGGNLKVAWTTHLAQPATPERLASANASPIVYNGTMYVQDAYTRITALDGGSGKTLWQFDPQIGLNVPGNGTNMRSLAMGDGMIFTGAYGTVYRMNAEPGTQVWATQVVNPVGGGGIDTSPVYDKGTVIIGTTGGDWGGACIGVGLDAKTGKVKWHYSFIPSNPKQYGWNTWPANRYYYGGAAIWDMPALSTKTGYVYFGTGQPLPFNGLINGPGAELGTDGVYALDAMTGKFKWFYQEVHHDIWDFDSMQTPLVTPVTVNGKKVEAVTHINKNAYYFVLDAATGKSLLPVKETPFPQNARAHTYPTQPIPQYDELVPHKVLDPEHYQGVIAPDGKPYLVPPENAQPYYPYTDEQFVAVVGLGGVRWPTPAFDPTTETEYACTNYSSLAMEAPAAADQHPVITNAGAIIQWRISTPTNAISYSRLVAFKPGTGKVIWKYDEPTTGGVAAGNATTCD